MRTKNRIGPTNYRYLSENPAQASGLPPVPQAFHLPCWPSAGSCSCSPSSCSPIKCWHPRAPSCTLSSSHSTHPHLSELIHFRDVSFTDSQIPVFISHSAHPPNSIRSFFLCICSFTTVNGTANLLFMKANARELS